MICPGTSWEAGGIELAWNRVEVGGNDDRLWWAALGSIWTPYAARSAASVKIRSGAYCIDAGKVRMTQAQIESLEKYLTALDPTRIPIW